ncbi:MAG TPA: class I SAM-dependent methyltransferase [Gemmatimonadaceae bacterium]|nr:class I SAM-dependent methyltransferase [Gemmatimonadaceae bacterium]
MLTLDEAVRHMRSRPEYRDVVRDAYLGPDVDDSFRRFAGSAEWEEVKTLLGDAIEDAVVVDLGAGTGIASRAFIEAGARRVYALEPDPSDEVGYRVIRRLTTGMPVEIVSSYGEHIPFSGGSADIVYARQVLHHTRDLDAAVAECARVLRPGGYFIACREHVVRNDAELQAFLAGHPVHQLAGGENAYALPAYEGALRRAGLTIVKTLAPWDSVINAFPVVRSRRELEDLPKRRLNDRFGPLGALAARLPFVSDMLWARIRRPAPGQMYSFLARKS